MKALICMVVWGAPLTLGGCFAADDMVPDQRVRKERCQESHMREEASKYSKKFFIENNLDSHIEVEHMWAAVIKNPLEVFMVHNLPIPENGKVLGYTIKVDNLSYSVDLYFRYVHKKASIFGGKARKQQVVTLKPGQDDTLIQWGKFNAKKEKIDLALI